MCVYFKFDRVGGGCSKNLKCYEDIKSMGITLSLNQWNKGSMFIHIYFLKGIYEKNVEIKKKYNPMQFYEQFELLNV